MKISARKKSLKRKRKRRKRRKINKKSSCLKKTKKISKKQAIHLWMTSKKTLNHWMSLRKGQFLTFLISEKWWAGLKDSLCSSISSQAKFWKDKKNNSFWWKRRFKSTRKMDSPKKKKASKKTGRLYLKKTKTRDKFTMKIKWNCSNSSRILKSKMIIEINASFLNKPFKEL